VSLLSAEQLVYRADKGQELFLGQDDKTASELNAAVRSRTLARFGFSRLIFAASSLRLKIGGDAEFLPNSCFL
jgi:hypothetical protein